MGALQRPGPLNRPLSEINVTPFVDVMLVLLVIFMVTAPLMQQGVDAVDVGNVPPGGLSREIMIKEARAGVMITASHNPPKYNGIKVMGESGRGYTPDEDLALEEMYFSDDATAPLPQDGPGGTGKAEGTGAAEGTGILLPTLSRLRRRAREGTGFAWNEPPTACGSSRG